MLTATAVITVLFIHCKTVNTPTLEFRKLDDL